MRADILYAIIKLHFGENHITNVVRDVRSDIYYILIDNKFVGSVDIKTYVYENYQAFLEKIKEDILIHSGEILL